MPAYFSTEASFKKNILYPNFVSDVYSIFFQSGFTFKSGYWEGENMTLEQITEWNQRLLQKKFKLGFTQHVRHDYKQILLNTDKYSEMRLYWMYLNNRVNLSLIIPESDVLDTSETAFSYSRIYPIIQLLQKLWETGLVELVQSSLELDGGVFTIKQIKQGHLPCINPLCVLDRETADRFSNAPVNPNLVFKNVENNGVLIVDNSLIKV